MKKLLIGITGILFLLACQTLAPTFSHTDSIPTLQSSLVSAESATASLMPAPTSTASPTPTSAPTPTATLALIHQGPDGVTIPILLYHHIEISPINSQYYVPPEEFEKQMWLLNRWGYTTITIDLLLKSIYEGADLPARPILISFDDGHASVYNAAFPIMQKYGFTGINYIVGSYMGADKYMGVEELKQLSAAGWELGSHSMTHNDLTHQDSNKRIYEIFKSRKLLSEEVGVPVNSFAYPFGLANDDIFTLVHNAGYTSAMGVGYTHDQGIWNIFLLQRRDIKGTYDLEKFAAFLPWSGDPNDIPTTSPTP